MNNASDIINILVRERNQALGEKENQINYYKQKYDDLQRQLGYKENQINTIQNQLNYTENQLRNTENQLYDIQNQLYITQNQQNQLQKSQSQFDYTKSELQYLQNELQSTKNELQTTQNQLQNEKNLNDQLASQIKNYKENILSQKSMIDSLKNEIINIRVKYQYNNKIIVSLKDKIKKQEEIINSFNSTFKSYESDDGFNSPLTIYFSSLDNSIEDEIVCHNWDLFSKIEEELYKKYPILKTTDNFFLSNGKKIEKDRTFLDNQISDKSRILIVANKKLFN